MSIQHNSNSATNGTKSIKHFVSAVLLLMMVFSQPSFAVVEQVTFADSVTEQRYKALINELRCLVCQNQNLADSDADLAKDLRRKTAEMLRAGKTDQEILAFMRDRYGDFVLYKPPFNTTTAALWLGPFIVLFGVIITLILHIKRRQQEAMLALTKADSSAQRTQIQNLLRDSSNLLSDDVVSSSADAESSGTNKPNTTNQKTS